MQWSSKSICWSSPKSWGELFILHHKVWKEGTLLGFLVWHFCWCHVGFWEEGFLPQSCRRAVLTLLLKKDDLQDIKNWWPDSLLCTDYKVLSKVLANHWKRQWIRFSTEHKHCVPGRSTFDNLSLIRDILEVSSSLGCNTVLTGLSTVISGRFWKSLASALNFFPKLWLLYENIESVLKTILLKLQEVFNKVVVCLECYTLFLLNHYLKNMNLFIDGLVLPGFNVSFSLSAYTDDVIIIA